MQQTAAEIKLTPREAEVVALVCAGHPRKQIGQLLGISVNTVAMYLTKLYAAIQPKEMLQAEPRTKVDVVIWCHQHPEALAGAWVSRYFERTAPMRPAA